MSRIARFFLLFLIVGVFASTPSMAQVSLAETTEWMTSKLLDLTVPVVLYPGESHSQKSENTGIAFDGCRITVRVAGESIRSARFSSYSLSISLSDLDPGSLSVTADKRAFNETLTGDLTYSLNVDTPPQGAAR